MAFMIPVYELDTRWELVLPNGDTEWFDFASDAADYLRTEAHSGDTYEITARKGWFTRLSAPGYMDATDGSGPFDTEAAAREYIERTYEVDADYGEPFGEDCPGPGGAAA